MNSECNSEKREKEDTNINDCHSNISSSPTRDSDHDA